MKTVEKSAKFALNAMAVGIIGVVAIYGGQAKAQSASTVSSLTVKPSASQPVVGGISSAGVVSGTQVDVKNASGATTIQLYGGNGTVAATTVHASDSVRVGTGTTTNNNYAIIQSNQISVGDGLNSTIINKTSVNTNTVNSTLVRATEAQVATVQSAVAVTNDLIVTNNVDANTINARGINVNGQAVATQTQVDAVQGSVGGVQTQVTKLVNGDFSGTPNIAIGQYQLLLNSAPSADTYDTVTTDGRSKGLELSSGNSSANKIVINQDGVDLQGTVRINGESLITNQDLAPIRTQMGTMQNQINGIQSQVNSIQNQVNANRIEANRGIAGANAFANTPALSGHKDFAVGVAIGGYQGQSALAISASARLNKNAVAKVGFNTSGGFGAGVAAEW